MRYSRLFSFIAILVVTLSFQNCGQLESTKGLLANKSNSLSDNSSSNELTGTNSTPSTSTDEKVIGLLTKEQLPYKVCYGHDNLNSTITWCSSYELMGHLANYRATRDLSYLQVFLTHAYDILSKRDDILGIGKKQPLWSQKNYTNGTPYPTLVSTGMITYPLADFVKLVLLEDPLLGDIKLKEENLYLKDIAKAILVKVEESVAAHNPQWNSYGSYGVPSDTRSFYFDANGRVMADHHELPFNMYLALGRTIVVLSEVTQKQEYLIKAQAMAHRFKSWTSYNSRGNPYWIYWTFYPGVSEDVSHAAIDVDFLRLAFEANIPGVNRQDLTNLGNTFSDEMLFDAGKVHYLVTGEVKNHDYRNAMSWMSLAPYHTNLKYIGIDASRLHKTDSQGYGTWGLAMVKEHGGRSKDGTLCRQSSNCHSSSCVPDFGNAYMQGDKLTAKSYCRSALSRGSYCIKNRDCQSGSCRKNMSAAPLYVDLGNSLGVPLQVQPGTCQ